MKRRVLLATMSLATSLLVTTGPTLAVSPYVEVYQDKGQGAWADEWECHRDDPGPGDVTCHFSGVGAFDGRSRFNGERVVGDNVCYWEGTSVYDASKGTWTDGNRWGCSQDGQVAIDRDLASGAASATVSTQFQECVSDSETFDCTEPIDGGILAVDVDWTADGPASRSTARFVDRFGDCTWRYSSKGTGAEATADGTVAGVDVSFDYGRLQSGSSKYSVKCHD